MYINYRTRAIIARSLIVAINQLNSRLSPQPLNSHLVVWKIPYIRVRPIRELDSESCFSIGRQFENEGTSQSWKGESYLSKPFSSIWIWSVILEKYTISNVKNFKTVIFVFIFIFHFLIMGNKSAQTWALYSRVWMVYKSLSNRMIIKETN